MMDVEKKKNKCKWTTETALLYVFCMNGTSSLMKMQEVLRHDWCDSDARYNQTLVVRLQPS